MPFSALQKRIARLEDAHGVHEHESLDGILARAARLTPEERRARIRELEDQMFGASRMESTLENRSLVIHQFMLKHGIARPAQARLPAQTLAELELTVLSPDR